MRIDKFYDLPVEKGSWATSCNPMKEETRTALGKLIEVLEKDKKMHEFKTGAKRSEVKPRYDLIPKSFLERVAKRLTGEVTKDKGGAFQYGECNWEKGLATSDVINHNYDHLSSYANYFREMLKISNGDMSQVVSGMQSLSRNEDHLAGIACGLIFLMHQEDEGRMYHDDRFTVFHTDPPTSEVAAGYSDKYVEQLIKENQILKDLARSLEEELNVKYRKSTKRGTSKSRKSKRNSR